MKRPRSALRLPRYVRRKRIKSGLAYFFDLPTWARKKGDCPVESEALGADYHAAVQRAEMILLPQFDHWRGGDAVVNVGPCLDWVFAEYRADRRYTRLNTRTKRNHESGMRLVGGYVLKDGKRLGVMPLAAITTAVTDRLYEKLLIVTETDAEGNTIQRERRTTINHAMKTCRRAWNVAARRNPGKVPILNPFACMGLESYDRETPTAIYDELRMFRAKAVELGHPSLATAVLIGWEWLQREEDIFGTFDVAHYRPKERPHAVRVVHKKTREESWIPLLNDVGVPLYPELMVELDAIKRERIGGLMLRRDWGSHAPWPTWPEPDRLNLSCVSRKVKQIIRAAGLRDELTFTSFRHGGFTEMGDAGLSDAQIRAQGRHKSNKVLPKYVKRTMRQVAEGAQKRRVTRTENAQKEK